MRTWGIDTPQRQAAFLAQVAHESAGLTDLDENLSYSSDRLRDLGRQNGVGSRWAEAAKQADRLARNPKALANFVYADRLGNGDEASGDGWAYRGKGLKQITGKDNYRQMTTAVRAKMPDAPDFVQNPDALLDPKWAAASAAAFWHSRNLNPLADTGDIRAITRKINGGLIGYEDRKRRYGIALRALGGLHAG